MTDRRSFRRAIAPSAMLAILLASGGCGARSTLDRPDGEPACPDVPPTCVAPPGGDPCGAPTLVEATCDTASYEWRCPAGARFHARADERKETCLPFSDPVNGLAVGPWGLGSLAKVPVGDRCLWVVESVDWSDGTSSRNVAFEPDTTAPFGTCPETSISPPHSIVEMEDGDDPDAVFGVTELGGGIAHWDPGKEKIVVPSLSKPFPWGLDIDLGNAVMTSPDGAFGLIWGCTGGDGFTSPCRLVRADANDALSIVTPSGGWAAGADPNAGATFFSSGTWISSVVPTAAGFAHVYAPGFGTTLGRDTANDVTGTWTSTPDFAACELPAGDPKSFCAGPVAHPELADPTRPGEMPVSYSVGSTGAIAGNPHDHWPRLVWLSL